MVRIPFTSLTLSHIFACLKPGPGFPTWVSGCCSMPIQKFFSYIMVRTS
jgi:hypothetical protein